MDQTTPTPTLQPLEAKAAEKAPMILPFADAESFELAQRMGKSLAASSLVPATYQGEKNLGSVLIALEIASRLGASPLMVMQNLYVIHGRPSWSAQFIIAALNACGRFSPLRYEFSGEAGSESRGCVAWAVEKATGQRLDGPEVSMAMAKAEGWMSKSGSKWLTMPEVMLRYRAASFFGKFYAPEILMGMPTEDESEDWGPSAAGADVPLTVTKARVEQVMTKQEALETDAQEAPDFLRG